MPYGSGRGQRGVDRDLERAVDEPLDECVQHGAGLLQARVVVNLYHGAMWVTGVRGV